MFRITIRELLLLTLVVGMGAGWWASWRASRAKSSYLEKLAETYERVLIDRGCEVSHDSAQITISHEDGFIIYPLEPYSVTVSNP
jgi:hypothetical protein